ncbi:MAG: peptide chain release factor N(5)-glutamine methyltransferase, partial [Deltaproteobacteria bacterium]|nr:peptide chain release factor N(5)-glutamine methyltransferase [Deltaproteobacteria bacterium]
RSALDGGADGLRFYRSWIPGLPEFLCRDGHVLFEIGCDQGAAVSDLFRETGAFAAAQICADYAGLDRVVYAQKK